MNMLVDYESSSESEAEPTLPPQKGSNGRKDATDSDNKDESFISGALKELQDFSASVDASPGTPPKPPVGAATDDDLQFMSFMREIEAMPFIPDEPQGADPSFPPPPPPPTSPPMSSRNSGSPPPPPPPPPMLEEADSLPPTETVYSIYTRLQNLGLLPVTAIDQKDLKRRLLEFAIRIKDWERGGLDPGYFMGHERVEAITAGQDGPDPPKPSNEDGLPAFGGIAGSMVKYMYELEQLVTPRGWAATWDAEDEAYGFHHIQTGTYSPVYPSQEMITQLKGPEESSHPYLFSGSQMDGRNHTKPYYISTAKVPASISTLAWQQTSSNVHTPLDKPNTTPTANRTSGPSSPVTLNPGKKKRRKAVEPLGDPLAPQEQHIHHSRRAIFTQKGPAPSISSGGSKVMPKKLANLLQKWNEKDVDESDEDDEEDNSGRSSSDPRSAAVSGANSQSLGGDWRERRSNHR
ncbi:hypothetical protein BG000_005667 [Podila horticola]|nr:hypothetical protein BG000_005667 [Podila horticola]